jgi:nucleoside-diphosphate-sugar epimerase
MLESAGMTVRRAGRDVVGDIGEPTEWGPVVEGASTVVHLAARVHELQTAGRKAASDDAARYRAVNTIASEHLARAAAEAGVHRFILLSTVKVMGEASSRPLTAADPTDPRDSYARSKLEAEQAVAAVAGAMKVLILRPPLVYGPRVKGNFLRLMRAIDRGLPLPLGAIANRRSLLFVGNLSRAIEHALTAPAGVYLPTDGEDLSISELIRRLAAAMNRPDRLIAVPPSLVKLCARLAGRHEEFQKLAGSLQLDGILPGWTPSVSVQDGLQTTARWFVGAQQSVNSKNVD